jgi:hypothetical protein
MRQIANDAGNVARLDLRVDSIRLGDPAKVKDHARCRTPTTDIHRVRLSCVTNECIYKLDAPSTRTIAYE